MGILIAARQHLPIHMAADVLSATNGVLLADALGRRREIIGWGSTAVKFRVGGRGKSFFIFIFLQSQSPNLQSQKNKMDAGKIWAGEGTLTLVCPFSQSPIGLGIRDCGHPLLPRRISGAARKDVRCGKTRCLL